MFWMFLFYQNIYKISMLAGKVAVSCTHNPL